MEKLRLLVIDDALNLSLLYKEELSDDGYEVDVANSVSDAHILLNTKSYHLVIAEKNLKDINNEVCIWDILKKIRWKIPVLINTGEPMSEIEKRQGSFETYIEKSSDVTQLKNKVKDILGFAAA